MGFRTESPVLNLPPDEVLENLRFHNSVDTSYLQRIISNIHFYSQTEYEHHLDRWKSGSGVPLITFNYTLTFYDRCNLKSIPIHHRTKDRIEIPIFPYIEPASMVFNKTRTDLVFLFTEGFLKARSFGIVTAAEAKEDRYQRLKHHIETCEYDKLLHNRRLKIGDFFSVFGRCAVVAGVAGVVLLVEIVMFGKLVFSQYRIVRVTERI